MKAIQIERHGGPEVMNLREVPDPAPGPGQLLVRQAAIGVNFVDVYRRIGLPADARRAGLTIRNQPNLGDYIPDTQNLRRRASEVLGWTAAGKLSVLVGAAFPLAEAAEAHRQLEARCAQPLCRV
jgi:NADPH:quinone reductase-like Zn-dependent oxidoreductase